MRYSAEHKALTREKLLHSSGAIAKQGGFSAAGVDGLMKAIGLTGGAFYSHFASKNDLFAAIVERELQHSLQRLGDTAAGGREKLMEFGVRTVPVVARAPAVSAKELAPVVIVSPGPLVTPIPSYQTEKP